MITGREYTKQQRLLTIENLGVKYGTKVILRDINLTIDDIVRPGMAQGQVIALLGLSGSGKTQLFRRIAGLEPPTTGRVLLANNEPVEAGHIGVVQQKYPLLSHRTVLSNVMKGARNPQQREIGVNLLKKFKMYEFKDQYPDQLSGGQQQRIAIIQQLVCCNHVLLMDEPFSGLDIVAKHEVCEALLEVSTAHELNTIIFTTHDLETSIQIADTVWILGKEPGKDGTTIVHQIDLIERGLAWTEDVLHHPNYWPTVQELKSLFFSLR